MLRLSAEEVEARLMRTSYIDAELMELNYYNSTHLITMKYFGFEDDESEEKIFTVLFKDCFSANFNSWLEGMEGDIPKSPNDLSFYFHNISIEDVEVNGVFLYRCTMVIPMMECKITCKSIEIVES
ncbi:hypothetical protein [Planomicrobium okeanokoites]|uniref:hypothetical protein n=1 Tax=Planomicrobium okeanokoites TaxID=244 RepID=UPI000A0073A1|nr:hypothetical protein [Planomicrobium okeanokoites]